MGICINVTRHGFSLEENLKHHKACELLGVVLNSTQFYSAVLAADLENDNKMSNQEIYNYIMSGSEVLTPSVDNEIDVTVELYYANNKTVGYTKESTVKTWLNRKFFKDYDYAEVAGNLFHEWLHKLGFDHDSAKDHDSVPYALGYLVRDLVHDLMAGKVFSLKTDAVLNARAVRFETICERSWRTLWFKRCTVQRAWEV